MNWLKKLFTGTTGSTGPGPGNVAGSVPTSQRIRAREMSPPEAKRIEGESVRVWCDKLEAEANRTGNNRLRAQAANIRARFKV